MKRPSKRSNKPGGEDVRWNLEYKGFEPAEEGLREALSTLSNGYFGTRGAASEASASRVSYPGTYIAGVYNKIATPVAGRKIYNEDLVNCPNWLPINVKLSGGEWITLENSEVLSNEQRLDMLQGVLYRVITFRDKKGRRVRVSSERIVHLAIPHIGAIKYTVEPLDYEGTLYIRSSIDGKVENTGVPRYRSLRSRHLKADKEGFTSGGCSYLSVKTSQSDIKIAFASKARVFGPGESPAKTDITQRTSKKHVSHIFKLNVQRGDSYTLEKAVSIYTSRDNSAGDPLLKAVRSAERAFRFETLKRKQLKAWSDIWSTCGFRVEGDEHVCRAVNFHAFHLLQTATENNRHIDAALGARGLHGESYRGHIFWDEMFVMLLYDYQMPVVSQALLKYRYRRLDVARQYANKNGYKGAMFPWQSGATGEEETQVLHLNPMSGKWGPDYSSNQRHISFAIAYNVWKMWERTGDKAFMDKYGAEIFLSIASFAASLAEYSEKDGKFHTHGLMGPDEFHEKMPLEEKAGYTDNAYSNIFIVWILTKAKELLSSLSDKKRTSLMETAGISENDPARWEEITRNMNLIIRKDGVISQFEGYFSLKELNWDYYRKKYGDIHRMDRILKSEGKSPNAYKVAKQADVLMTFYIFSLREIKDLFEIMGYSFSKGILKTNYDYYVKRTSHGSTLSKVVHCYLAHIMNRKSEAWKWYLDVLDSDLNDVQGGTTPEGIHTGVMGGSLDIIARGFMGIDDGEGKLRIAPSPPGRVKKIDLEIQYRKHRLQLFLSGRSFKVKLLKTSGGKKPLEIQVYGRAKKIFPGKEYRFSAK